MLLCVFFPYNVGAQVAPGVLQSAAQTATITGTVVQSDGSPVSGANVQVLGPARLTTKTNSHGAFSFISVPYGTYSIISSAGNLGVVSRDNLVVRGDISVVVQYERTSAGLKTIARVSTQSTGANINVTPASIASVNPSDYAFQGNTSWQQLLNQIPGVTVGGQLYGGYGALPPGSPIQPVVLSINGALPYETAVMLDGMPFTNAPSGSACAGDGTDLSSVPMTTFETGDVIRGPGADAPSIVDSIGGTFVLHAPGRVEKDQYAFSASNDPYGGIVTNVKAKLHLGKLSATVIYGLNDSPGPLGTNVQEVTALRTKPLTVNGQPFLKCLPTGTRCYNLSPSNSYEGYFNYTYPLLIAGVPFSTAWTQHSYGIGLSYALTPSITAQVFYTGSAASQPFFAFESPITFQPGTGYAGTIVSGIHDYFYPPYYDVSNTQASHFIEEKLTAYVGHGVLRLAALQNVSFENINDYPCAPPNGQYTLWGTGYTGTTSPGTPVVFNGTPVNLTFSSPLYSEKLQENSRDLLLSYATQVGHASNVSISYVTSYYDDPYTYSEGTLSGGIPSASSATTREVRIHAGIQVSDKLSLDASWYFARGNYHVQNPNDPTGNTYMDSTFPYNAPRVGAVWRINNDAVIRAAAGGGYALPPLLYLSGIDRIVFQGANYYDLEKNLNLTPEKSFGFDIGTDVRLRRDTVLSFDVYRTNLYGQFYTSTLLTGTFSGLPLYTSEYRNLAQTRMEGINVALRHDTSHGVYWNAALGLTHAYVVSVPAGFYDSQFGTNCANTYIVPGINFDGQFQSTVPYANGAARFGYRWSSGAYIDLAPTYYGNGNPYFEPAFVEFDADAAYPLTKNLSVLTTFRNITGIYGQAIQTMIPTLGAENIAASDQLPNPLYGTPYGPRSVVVTLNFHN